MGYKTVRNYKKFSQPSDLVLFFLPFWWHLGIYVYIYEYFLIKFNFKTVIKPRKPSILSTQPLFIIFLCKSEATWFIHAQLSMQINWKRLCMRLILRTLPLIYMNRYSKHIVANQSNSSHRNTWICLKLTPLHY